jgi:predicted amidophosphoribosyltransferase
MSSLRSVTDLLGLVWPVSCAGCSLPGVSFCAACTGAFDARPVRVSLTGWPAAPPAWACAVYSGQVSAAVIAWKDRGRHDLTAVLGAALARAVLAALPQGAAGPAGPAAPRPVLLVPVPSRRSARRRRGEDVGRSLAGCAAVRVRAGLPAGARPAPLVRVVPALRLPAGVRDQSGLGAAERGRNLAGATRLRRGAVSLVAGQDCLVVDDVLTTGASARAAAAALESAGARVVGLAAACATPLRRGLSADARWD